MAHNRVVQWSTMSRIWWLYDAKYQCPFRSARIIAGYLQGQHKPIYHALSDVGDHVVVINSRHIAMREELWRTFTFSYHTGYAKGFSRTPAWRLHSMEPTMMIEKAVYSNMPGFLLRRKYMRRLHIYPDEEVPPEILGNVCDQIQQIQKVPKRLDEYTAEEIQAFPKLFDWSEEYVMENISADKPKDTVKAAKK
ncbi:39S ribosomal protein L13, mitochondrial-like [Crassostrea angulata]|uniref:39S ribosomal protein L13, mitochondrial-like n=1 Tax=Magallana angulata TaxID=2784310 RepID=UPI0022B1C080|nr:39S ribosomal protein L13, mitochondrial-like [Crassostrea angulata]